MRNNSKTINRTATGVGLVQPDFIRRAAAEVSIDNFDKTPLKLRRLGKLTPPIITSRVDDMRELKKATSEMSNSGKFTSFREPQQDGVATTKIILSLLLLVSES